MIETTNLQHPFLFVSQSLRLSKATSGGKHKTLHSTKASSVYRGFVNDVFVRRHEPLIFNTLARIGSGILIPSQDPPNEFREHIFISAWWNSRHKVLKACLGNR